MKLPKGKLLTLLAVFAAIGLVTTTGAFTTVTAERTATVSVSGDASALLAMGPYDGPNGVGDTGADADGGMASSSEASSSSGYAQLTDGTLEINMAGFGNSIAGQGVNLDATTDIKRVFVITNQGSQAVNVTIADSDADGNESDAVTFYNGSVDTGSLEGQNTTLDVGESLVVSIYVDTTGMKMSDVQGNNLVTSIEVRAEATS